MNKSYKTLRLVYTAMFLAVALVLPFLTGQIPEIGNMLCPMHIPAFLCGMICGWQWGALMGFVAPLLRSLLFSAPPMYPKAVGMAFELMTYGAVAGVLYKRLPKKKSSVYAALICAMLAGRIVWGCVNYLLLFAKGTSFTLSMFFAQGFTAAVPGIILHILLIPPVVNAMQKAGHILNH